MDTSIDSPQVVKCSATIVGALEDQVADVRCLGNHLVDEEFDLIEDADVVLLVLDLEIAVCCGTVSHVDHVFAVSEFG